MKGTIVLAFALVACSGGNTAAPTTTATTTPASTTVAPTTASTTTVPEPVACDATQVGIGDPVFGFAGNPGFDVDLYDADVTFDIPTKAGMPTSITVAEVITATATEDLDTFNLDLSEKTVNAVAVDGTPATFCSGTDEVTIIPAATISGGSKFTVEVGYQGNPFKGSSGALSSPWIKSGPGLIFFGEPLGARSWLASNNHPSDGARIHLTVTVPEGLTVVGPGELVSTETAAGTTTFRWELDQPIATYLIPLAIDNFEVRDFEGPIPITVWYDENSAGEVASFASQGAIIEALAEWFGPFPYDRSGAIVFDPASEFNAALETTPYPTYDRNIFRFTGIAVVAHELAHMWAGNSVRLENWDDIWLKEGMATFAEWLWAEAQGGTSAYDEQVSSSRSAVTQTLAQVSLPPMGAPGSGGDLYSIRSYDQAGLAFAALRAMVGDDDFRSFLQEWYSTYAGQAAGTDEFLGLLGERFGEEPVALIQSYLDAVGLPPGLDSSG